jgi:phage terminase large subunit
MTYIASQHKLIIFDEFRGNKLSNERTANILMNEKGVTHNDLITCDSAEKKSVGDYRAFGLLARPAEKGPGSVEYSMKWLQSLREIVIDNRRCPNTVTEFLEYEYERDKEGNVISGYPDKNNHHIDAVRYAMERVWKKRGE